MSQLLIGSVEAFDGGGEEHGVRQAGGVIDGEEKVAGKLG